MMETRAVRVSHELWKQMFTEGYVSGGLRCIKGLPEDARLVESFAREEQFHMGGDGEWVMRSDPVFVFESESWDTPTPDDTVVNAVREVIPLFFPVFQRAECRTCKHWAEGETAMEMDFCTQLGTPVGPSFGCTSYEPRETDD